MSSLVKGWFFGAALISLAIPLICCNEQSFPLEDPNLKSRQIRIEEASALISQIVVSTTKESIALLSHNDYRVRRATVLRIGELSDTHDEAVDGLINALKDNHPRVRTAATRALAMRADTKAIDPLVRAVADQNRKVRLWAWKALQKFDHEDVFPVFILHLSKQAQTTMLSYKDEIGKTVFLRLELNTRIPTLKKAAVQPMIEALSHPDTWVRGSALLILGDIGSDAKDALPALASFVDSKDEHHAIWMTETFEKIGDLDPIVMPTLKAASQSSDKKLVRAAKKAIKSIENVERKKNKEQKEQEKKRKKREEKAKKKREEKSKLSS